MGSLVAGLTFALAEASDAITYCLAARCADGAVWVRL